MSLKCNNMVETLGCITPVFLFILFLLSPNRLGCTIRHNTAIKGYKNIVWYDLQLTGYCTFGNPTSDIYPIIIEFEQ